MATQPLETRTERVVVLMTPSEKREIAVRAKDAGLSIGEYMRAAAAFETLTPSEQRELELLAQELRAATERTRESLDRLEALSSAPFDEAALREKYRREFEARKDIDWGRFIEFLGAAQ